MKKSKFKIVDKFFNNGDSIFPIDWSKLKNEILEKVPSNLLYNIFEYDTKKHAIVEKTIVYVVPSDDTFDDSTLVLDNDDILIEIKKYM